MKKLTLIICSLVIAAAMQAQVIHVPADYPTIQQGIDAATPGDTVLVADGTYYEQISFLGKKPLLVASEFILDGDTNHINNTIIDGSQLTNMDLASVVYFTSGEDTTTTLCGFTVRGGKGTYSNNLNRCGGGIYISNSGARIIHNKITGNTIDDTQPVNGQSTFGGGIGTSIAPGDFWIVIEHNRIFGNSIVSKWAWAGGGGVFSAYESRIKDNDIYENSTTGTAANTFAQGGGISNAGSFANNTVIIDNNKIHHNIAQSSIGTASDAGVGTQFAHLIFTNNEVYENEGLTGVSNGGVGGLAIIDPAEGCIVSGNTFRENISQYDGGGIYILNLNGTPDPNPVIISGNYFINNEAKRAGALMILDIPITFQNNVCSGNTAVDRGGAIMMVGDVSSNYHHLAVMINNSFYNNSCNNYGGALYCINAKPLIFNSLFYNDNANYGGAEIYVNNTLDTLDIAYCNIDMDLIRGNIYDGGGNINEEPLFDDTELLTLTGDSPCINAGTTFYTCHCGNTRFSPQEDILGYARPQYGAYDMGAYEFFGVGVPEKVSSQQSAVSSFPNPSDGIFNVQFTVYNLQRVTLKIYDLQGREIAAVLDEELPAGEHSVRFDASGLPAGVYFYRLTTNDQRLTTSSGKLVKL